MALKCLLLLVLQIVHCYLWFNCQEEMGLWRIRTQIRAEFSAAYQIPPRFKYLQLSWRNKKFDHWLKFRWHLTYKMASLEYWPFPGRCVGWKKLSSDMYIVIFRHLFRSYAAWRVRLWQHLINERNKATTTTTPKRIYKLR